LLYLTNLIYIFEYIDMDNIYIIYNNVIYKFVFLYGKNWFDKCKRKYVSFLTIMT